MIMIYIKKEIIKKLEDIKDTYKSCYDNYNKLLVVLSLITWSISFISALMVFIEIIELKDFESNTGFIPSTIEFAVLAVVSWHASQKLADRIIVKA